ncbi:MAG: ABC transporter ATP-binding protein/permease [Clostridiales bacterium]|nr:ABC transporter ATP-binding protein/permease [Clostridiales bacterium]
MLQLKNIVKDYGDKENVVHALKGVSLNFRESEFVAILGQSGCGKTTLLNIVGGLDRYTDGDLIIDGVSTKKYQDVDWDAYRNVRIGFIFQSYNLITHQDILSNVEMALTLSGIPAKERKERALKALEEVGLKDQAHKKPNQLSGGQMQRVSIARALINNPNIILADEPTGALDSNTSIQIMDILKDIAKDRLVIMVTHNPELADQYATRIIRLSDGEVIGDTNPYEVVDEEIKQEEVILDKKEERKIAKEKKKTLARTSMSFLTAIKLSFNNLMTKKGRTILTSIAGSIGIIGVALVLAISNGFQQYVDNMQTDMLAGYPIEIAEESYDYEMLLGFLQGEGLPEDTTTKKEEFPTTDEVSAYDIDVNKIMQDAVYNNNLDEDYVAYLEKMDKSWYSSIYYQYAMKMNVLTKRNLPYLQKNKGLYLTLDRATNPDAITNPYQPARNQLIGTGWSAIKGPETFINSQYDKLYGTFPTKKDEVLLVINTSNQLSAMTMAALGLDPEKIYTFSEMVEELNQNPLKVYTNNEYYYQDGEGLYKVNNTKDLYLSDAGIPMKVVGVYRQKQGTSFSTLREGICYTQALTDYMLQDSMTSDVVEAQRLNSEKDVRTGEDLVEESEMSDMAAIISGGGMATATAKTQKSVLGELGGIDTPTAINIYPVNFEMKGKITAYLDAWNEAHQDDKDKQVNYNDMAALLASMLSEMIRILTIALTAFSSVSLVVSSFMIGIITYVSVVERTKEIGILRSLGARKKDISRVFNAEAVIIGFTAGVIGVIVTYILSIPINIIINWKVGMAINICALHPLAALAMVALSMFLTFIAGLIPSRLAAKRDPVIALRTD